MRSLMVGWWLVLVIAVALSSPIAGQNLEGGFHAGLGVLGDETVLGRETGPEFGVWLMISPIDRLAVAADWSYLPREDWESTAGGFPVGEAGRNRQYVDLTLQYVFFRQLAWDVFVEAGGGALWNNRQVVNPNGIPELPPQGKESTKKGVFTLGGGLRFRLAPHLNWISEVKAHNPGSSEKDGFRFITGLTVSWR